MSTRGSGLGMVFPRLRARLLHVLSGQEHWNVSLRDPYIVHSSYHGISFEYDCICCKRGHRSQQSSLQKIGPVLILTTDSPFSPW